QCVQLLDEVGEPGLVIRRNSDDASAMIRRLNVGHSDSAHDRAAFAQGELQVEILADAERFFTLELKSSFSQIANLTGHCRSTPLDLTCPIDCDSKQLSLLDHRSAHLSSSWRNTRTFDAAACCRRSSSFASIAVGQGLA